MPKPNPTFLPNAIDIIHIPWEPGTTKDAHGNIGPGAYSPTPINRKAIAWWPLERKTWEPDQIDPDVVARLESDIHILVKNPEIYTVQDIVKINVSTTKTAEWLTYRVQNIPTNWAAALPFQAMSYGMLVPGEIHCRRVTNTAVLQGQ